MQKNDVSIERLIRDVVEIARRDSSSKPETKAPSEVSDYERALARVSELASNSEEAPR